METDKDHIHYMIETEPTMSISKMVNRMKSYTTYHIWKKYPNDLRKHFWERAYLLDGRIFRMQRRECFRRDATKVYRKPRLEKAVIVNAESI